MNQPRNNLRPLSADEKPPVLFRVECAENRGFNTRGDLCARRPNHGCAPRRNDFDNHLRDRPTPTGLLSFSSNWRRSMDRKKNLENRGKQDVIVIAVWAVGLNNVYSAGEVATTLEYPSERIVLHTDEYLVEDRIWADEYRVLAIFHGSGPDRDVDFEYSLPGIGGQVVRYTYTAKIPGGFFPGRRSNNPLEDLGEEVYSCIGVRNDLKRDAIVQAIMARPRVCPLFLYPFVYGS